MTIEILTHGGIGAYVVFVTSEADDPLAAVQRIRAACPPRSIKYLAVHAQETSPQWKVALILIGPYLVKGAFVQFSAKNSFGSARDIHHGAARDPMRSAKRHAERVRSLL